MHSLLQILADAPVMDTVLPISPLDPRQSRIKQEDCRELHVSHCAADMDYQVGWLQDCHAAHVLIPYSALSKKLAYRRQGYVFVYAAKHSKRLRILLLREICVHLELLFVEMPHTISFSSLLPWGNHAIPITRHCGAGS